MDWIQFVMMLCAVIGLVAGGIISLIKLGMMLAQLKKEVTPNGGNTKSLGDRMVRVEALVQRHTHVLETQNQTLAAQNDSLARLEKAAGIKPPAGRDL